MSIDDLRLLPDDEARDLLARAGFEKLQQLKLMQSATPPPAAASLSPAAASHGQAVVCIASKSLAVDPAFCKDAGLSAIQLFKRIGFELANVRAAGFELPSLKAAGYDAAAFRAAGCSWADVKTAGFTAVEAKAAGCDLAAAMSVGHDVRLLVAALGADAVVAAGCDCSSCMLVSCTVTQSLIHALPTQRPLHRILQRHRHHRYLIIIY